MTKLLRRSGYANDNSAGKATVTTPVLALSFEAKGAREKLNNMGQGVYLPPVRVIGTDFDQMKLYVWQAIKTTSRP